MDGVCDRCQSHKGGMARHVTMLGGYEAELCVPCCNAWAEIAQTLAETCHEILDRAAFLLAEAGAGHGDAAACAQAREELKTVHRELFALATKWIAEGKPVSKD